jgi:hypothetical protein
MNYLIYLKKTHKAEVSSSLAADPLLEKELEFDLKLFAREEAERLRRKCVNVNVDTYTAC